MKRISSASTIILSLFIPVFWFVFFGSFTAGILFSDSAELPFSFNGALKWIVPSFFILFTVLFYFTLVQLKRVDIDEHFLYVSNYFITVRIPFDQIKALSCKSVFFRQLGKITLVNKGRFGSRILFIAESEKYNILQSILFPNSSL